MRHLPRLRWPSFCSGWPAADPDKKACKGALDICWEICRFPHGHVARAGPVGMSCEAEVGCGKKKIFKKNSSEVGKGKWLFF